MCTGISSNRQWTRSSYITYPDLKVLLRSCSFMTALPHSGSELTSFARLDLDSSNLIILPLTHIRLPCHTLFFNNSIYIGRSVRKHVQPGPCSPSSHTTGRYVHVTTSVSSLIPAIVKHKHLPYILHTYTTQAHYTRCTQALTSHDAHIHNLSVVILLQ